MKMPFGKYKNQDIIEVPTHYLEWLLNQNPTANIREACKQEIIRRENPGIGTITKFPKHVFMEELAKLIVKTPDEFLQQEYFLDTLHGKFSIRIRRQ